MMDHIKENRFSWWKRLHSFKYAFEGLKEFFRKEHNAWIHLSATITVIILAIVLRIAALEIIVLVITIGSVWTTELINTAIEKTIDLISLEKRKEIKWIKDLAAAAVFVTAIAALITGGIIFIPKIF